MSEEAAYKPRMVFMQSVVLNSQTTPPHAAAAALWFPQGFSVEFQPGRLVAISGLFHCWNRFWSANTKGPTKIHKIRSFSATISEKAQKNMGFTSSQTKQISKEARNKG